MNLAFISATPLISPSDLYTLARRIEIGAAHCVAAWTEEQQLRHGLVYVPVVQPAIEVFASDRKLPDGWAACVFYENVADGHGALADHGWDPVRHLPSLRVMVGQASGLFTGNWSVSEAASHEVLEAECNAEVKIWEFMPGRVIVPGTPGIETPREVSDATQEHYTLNDDDHTRLSSFVTPAWFDLRLADPEKAAEFRAAGGKFDHLGSLSRAGEIVAGEGYVVLRDQHRRWTETASGGQAARTKPGSTDPLGRTERLLSEAA